MLKKMLLAGATITASAALVLATAGCGSSSPQPQAQNPQNAAAQAANSNLSQQLDALKKTQVTVQEVTNGQNSGKWTQGSDGSWRWDAQDGSNSSTMIYNASQNKTWTIDGNTATESSVAASAYAGFNPMTMLAAFAYLPQTSGSGDTREYDSNGEKLTVELKGTNGLPSKVTSVDAQGKTNEWDFDYSDVPSSTFDLPSGVQVQTVPSIPNTGNTPTDGSLPSGGSIPGVPQQ